jgi:nucleoid DNA-binding protein
MKALIDEILTCLATISEQGQQVIEHIRAMSRDDPQFADCTTFTQYIQKATEIIDQNPPTGSEPQVHETNVVEFRPSKPR